MSRRPLVVFQLDSVSVAVLEEMLAAGDLPTLAALRARGRWTSVDTAAVYFGDRYTAHTGTTLLEHGQYFAFQWSPREQRVRFASAFPAPEAVWERLARAGRRSLVLDPYEARRPRVTAGVCLSGWQFAHTVVLQRWSAPRGAYSRLAGRFGWPPEVEDVYGTPSAASRSRLRRQLLRAPERVTAAARMIAVRAQPDLVWIEFGAAHLAGHHFWEARGGAGDGTLREVYAAVDHAMEAILDSLPPESDVIVFSPVSMGPNTSRSDVLPQMIEAVLGRGASSDRSGLPTAAIWRLRKLVPASARLLATRLLPDAVALELLAHLNTRGADWRRTRAFALPADHDGYVRLNLRGREREGIVEPRDADALVDELVAGLATFRSPGGIPLVAGVDRVAELVGEGPRSEQLPDLIVRWSDRPVEPGEAAVSPAFGEIPRAGAAIGRLGNHLGGAWLLISPGPGTRPRELRREPELADIAATACALLEADGRGLRGEALLERA